MIRLNLMLTPLFLLLGYAFAFSQESQESTPTHIVATTSESMTSSEGKSVAPKPLDAEVSEHLAKKVRAMEKVAANIKGEDDGSLEILGGKIEATIASLPLDNNLIAAVKDKRFDWRIRGLIMLYKSYTASESTIAKYSDDFIFIMRDKAEHARVRAMAALMLVDASAKNAKVNEALKNVAKASDTPAEVLKAVMAAVGYAGIDDADVLMKLTEREPAAFNDIGINLNAVRALGKSKDPRAIGYLIKIYDNSVPDSFYNYTAIEQFWNYIDNSETRERVKPLIIPRFLKILDDRSPIGSSREEAAAILAELKVNEAVEPILRWFLPANGTSAKVGGGGYRVDVFSGARLLVKFGDKRAIPVLEQTINNFAHDSRWSWTKDLMEKNGQKFPDDHQDYKNLKECLKQLKQQSK